MEPFLPGPPEDAPVVLFVTDNGHGLGHLTRMLAVARRAGGRFRPLFLTLSEAYPVLKDWGMPVEYMPSYRRMAMTRASFQPIFARRLLALLNHVRPRAVVVDHIHPLPVMGQIRGLSRGIEWVWSRRGMWRRGFNVDALARSANFDTILEPSDVAAPMDAGATMYDRDRVVTVPPVVLIPPDEQLPRDRAREELGLPREGKAVLILLSDSETEKLASLIGRVRDVVREVAGPDTSLFAPLHILHRGRLPVIEGVAMKPVYPMSRYLQGFDAVVSTAGYNSYHEVVASGVPAVFVARDTNSLDDQKRRAEFGALAGRSYYSSGVFEADFPEMIARALRPGEREIAARVTAELGSFDGAGAAADFLASRVFARRWEPYEVPTAADLGLRSVPLPFRSGDLDPGVDPSTLAAIGYLLIGSGEEWTRDEVSRVAERYRAEGGMFRPVFLIDDVDPIVFGGTGFVFETVLTRDEWDGVASGSYDDYLAERLAAFPDAYHLDRIEDLRPVTIA